MHRQQLQVRGLDCEVLGDLMPRLVVGGNTRIELELVGVCIDLVVCLCHSVLTPIGNTFSRQVIGSTEAAGLCHAGLRC